MENNGSSNKVMNDTSNNNEPNFMSKNIKNTESSKTGNAVFAEEKPHKTKDFIKKLNPKNPENPILKGKRKWILLFSVIFVALVVAGVIVFVSYNNSKDHQYEETEAAVAAEYVDEENDDLPELRLNQALKRVEEMLNQGDEQGAIEYYAGYINYLLSQGDDGMFSAFNLIIEGAAYFEDRDMPRAALTMLTKVNIPTFAEIEQFLIYEIIMELADELGDDSIKAEYQPLYDKAKAASDQYEGTDDEEYDAEIDDPELYNEYDAIMNDDEEYDEEYDEYSEEEAE